MKILKLFAALSLLVMTLVAVPAATPPVVLPEHLFPQLDAILQQAVQQSPRMVSRAIDLEVAENNRIASRAGLLPNVSASASYYKSRDKLSYIYDDPASNSISTYTVTKTPYSVSLSQPVYHWGALQNSLKIAEISQNITQGQYREAYRVLAQTLRAEYLRLIVLKQTANRWAYHLETVSEQTQQEEDRLAKKVISEAEIFGVRINHERAQIATERAEFDLQNAVRSFARLAGLGPEFTVDSIPDSIPSTTPRAENLNQLLAGFLSQKDYQNQEAVSLRQQLEIEHLTYKIQRARLRPKVNFSAAITQDVQNNLYGSGLDYSVASQYAGISVGWAIFDGFSAKAAASSSLARRRMLENDYRQLTERLAQDAQGQMKSTEFAARNMSISERLLLSGEDNLRARNEDFGRGVTSEAAVRQANLGLFDAQIEAYNARRTYLLNVVDFLGMVVEDPVLINLANDK